MKEVVQKGSQIILLHLQEISKVGKSIKDKNRLVIARGRGEGIDWEMTANGSTVSFESDENILKLTQCWLHNYVKSLKSLDYILRFFKDFLMRTNFKVFIESITILFLFCFGFFGQKQCGIFFSSLIRDQTCTPCIERPSLNHWTTREVSEFCT